MFAQLADVLVHSACVVVLDRPLKLATHVLDEQTLLFSVSGRQSSRVTKVPLAQLHRVLRIMESLEFAMKRKRRKVK